jgi:hypothetical protein
VTSTSIPRHPAALSSHVSLGLDESVLDTNRGHGVQPVYVLRNVENPDPFRF